MKYSYILPAIVATAYAQDACGVVAGDGSEATGTANTIAVALVAINSTTVALNQTIDSFQGPDQVGALATAGLDILNEINRQNEIVGAAAPIADDDPNVFALPPYVSSLGCSVNYTVDNLISKKQLLVDACVGPVVLQNIQQQQDASAQFQATVKSKIPEFLQGISDDLAAPIGQALAAGASAFADQTTVPASCSPSSTTTTTTTTSGSATTQTSTSVTGGGVYPTTTSAYGWSAIPYPTEDNNSYPPTTGGAYPTASAYPTHGGEEEEEDCEEEEYPTKTGGDSYPTGGNAYPTGGDVHTSAVWEPVYPTGGASPSKPVYPTGGANPSYPAGNPSYPANPSYPVNPSLPVTTGYATKPATSSYAVWSTSSAPYKPIYTGGAAANAANFGAVAFAVAAAAML